MIRPTAINAARPSATVSQELPQPRDAARVSTGLSYYVPYELGYVPARGCRCRHPECTHRRPLYVHKNTGFCKLCMVREKLAIENPMKDMTDEENFGKDLTREELEQRIADARKRKAEEMRSA